ncbi:hypothetical protein H0176_27425, partial [Methylorubrum populi]|nr:hypothetical protein [Methylorubrum populi]
MAFRITVVTEPVGRDELTPVDLQVAPVDSINDLAPYTLRGIRMRKAKPGAQQPAAEVDACHPDRRMEGPERVRCSHAAGSAMRHKQPLEQSRWNGRLYQPSLIRTH